MPMRRQHCRARRQLSQAPRGTSRRGTFNAGSRRLYFLKGRTTRVGHVAMSRLAEYVRMGASEVRLGGDVIRAALPGLDGFMADVA